MKYRLRKLHAYLPEALPRDTVHRIQSQGSPHALAFLCRLKAARIHKHANGLREEERRAKASDIREALNDKKRGLGRAYAKLRNGVAKPIGFLADPSGRITAHPTEVDRIIQQAWAPVYQGQDSLHSHSVGDFLAKYKDFIYRGEPFSQQPPPPPGTNGSTGSGPSCQTSRPTGWPSSST